MKLEPLAVGIVGCGLIGRKRAGALGSDHLIGCYDIDSEAATWLADTYSCTPYGALDDLLAQGLDVVVVATVHNRLAEIAGKALESGAHVLVEKPAGTSSADVLELVRLADEQQRVVKVGFNHRFHPGVRRAIEDAISGRYGETMFVRGRYGHGGRTGYDKEWRADPSVSGGGELVDQGMHFLDLSYWALGELPVSASIIRTHFWDAPVEDNAVLLLGNQGRVGDSSPWAMFHVSWTEWKNLFSLEIYCRTAKFSVEGLGGSYGPETLSIYRMRPELGPPDVETVRYSDRDVSWDLEWVHFADFIKSGGDGVLLGDLSSALYAWRCVETLR